MIDDNTRINIDLMVGLFVIIGFIFSLQYYLLLAIPVLALDMYVCYKKPVKEEK